MPTRVYYSSWQLQCCGDPFSVGDTVSWTALVAEPRLREQLGAEGEGIEWLEEHHPDDDMTTLHVSGRVVDIRAIWQKHAPQDPHDGDYPLPLRATEGRLLHPVDGAVLAEGVESADGWREDHPLDDPDYLFDGYAITLA